MRALLRLFGAAMLVSCDDRLSVNSDTNALGVQKRPIDRRDEMCTWWFAKSLDVFLSPKDSALIMECQMFTIAMFIRIPTFQRLFRGNYDTLYVMTDTSCVGKWSQCYLLRFHCHTLLWREVVSRVYLCALKCRGLISLWITLAISHDVNAMKAFENWKEVANLSECILQNHVQVQVLKQFCW